MSARSRRRSATSSLLTVSFCLISKMSIGSPFVVVSYGISRTGSRADESAALQTGSDADMLQPCLSVGIELRTPRVVLNAAQFKRQYKTTPLKRSHVLIATAYPFLEVFWTMLIF